MVLFIFFAKVSFEFLYCFWVFDIFFQNVKTKLVVAQPGHGCWGPLSDSDWSSWWRSRRRLDNLDPGWRGVGRPLPLGLLQPLRHRGIRTGRLFQLLKLLSEARVLTFDVSVRGLSWKTKILGLNNSCSFESNISKSYVVKLNKNNTLPTVINIKFSQSANVLALQ